MSLHGKNNKICTKLQSEAGSTNYVTNIYKNYTINTDINGLILGLVFMRCSFQILAKTLTFLSELFHGFPLSLQKNVKIVPSFVQNSSEFIIHKLFHHLMLYSVHNAKYSIPK